MTGTEKIQQAFHSARQSGRAALMPYFTLGYPSPAASLEVVEALARSGADLIELGVPFSDPLADGPTIQQSTHTALQNGMSVERCLTMAKDLRQGGVKQPLLLMGYINPILSFGLRKFTRRAAGAGVDGLIVPDLPVEEAPELEGHCQAAGVALVYMLAPTSTLERIRLLAGHSSGFLYLVSVTGVTGARQSMAPDLAEFVGRVRSCTNLPLAVGFGISTPAQAEAISRVADGVIVGSALIHAAGHSAHPAQAAGDFLLSLRRATNYAGKTKDGLQGR